MPLSPGWPFVFLPLRKTKWALKSAPMMRDVQWFVHEDLYSHKRLLGHQSCRAAIRLFLFCMDKKALVDIRIRGFFLSVKLTIECVQYYSLGFVC